VRQRIVRRDPAGLHACQPRNLRIVRIQPLPRP
jgi:hypothetical protein